MGLLDRCPQTIKLIKEDNSKEIAKNLLEMDLDIDKISKATGLSKKDIQKIKEEINSLRN